MGCCGGLGPARRGATCRPSSAIGRASTCDIVAGLRTVHGSTCSTSCVAVATRRKAGTGRWEWIPLPRGRISMRRGRHARRRSCPPRGALPNYKSSDQDHDREALGRSRGGLTTKVHLAADLRCRPVARVITAGQRNDSVVFNAVMDRIRITAAASGVPEPGRATSWPTRRTPAARFAPACADAASPRPSPSPPISRPTGPGAGPAVAGRRLQRRAVQGP